MAEKNVFGQPMWQKKKAIQTIGAYAKRRILNANEMRITGEDMLRSLPERGVLFVANHQTVFTDVIAMYQTFLKAGSEHANYLRDPRLNVYYIAARETMNKGLLPKLFTLAGAVTVERSWREGEADIQRAVKPEDTQAIGMAIDDGWVVTFPQGTTRPGAPVRKGTAHLIKQYRPIVVPVRVDGFRDAFDKAGLKHVDSNATLELDFRPPLDIDYEADSVDDLVRQLGIAIGVQGDQGKADSSAA